MDDILEIDAMISQILYNKAIDERPEGLDVDRENLEKELDELELVDLAEDGFMDGITREYTGVILDDTYD